MKVIFENKEVVGYIKPHGMPVQDDLSGDTSLYSLVLKEYPEAGLIHRLDRQVAGLVVFAKSKDATAYLNKEIQSRKVKKTYFALVEGQLEEKSGHLINLVSKNKKMKKAELDPKGKKAELKYEVIKESSSHSLIKVDLMTGRFHQIRVQFASLGHPIVNDKKYGAESFRGHREIGLYACRFSYKDKENNWVEVTIDKPSTWPFTIINTMKD